MTFRWVSEIKRYYFAKKIDIRFVLTVFSFFVEWFLSVFFFFLWNLLNILCFGKSYLLCKICNACNIECIWLKPSKLRNVSGQTLSHGFNLNMQFAFFIHIWPNRDEREKDRNDRNGETNWRNNKANVTSIYLPEWEKDGNGNNKRNHLISVLRMCFSVSVWFGLVCMCHFYQFA